MRVQPDDDVTLFDGRGGIVIGVDGSWITILPDGGGDRLRVPMSDLATINQQETRPRAGASSPFDGLRPMVVWSREEVMRRYPKAEGR